MKGLGLRSSLVTSHQSPFELVMVVTAEQLRPFLNNLQLGLSPINGNSVLEVIGYRRKQTCRALREEMMRILFACLLGEGVLFLSIHYL